MKATGIVRRIDELGRIVIPKEIRKILRLRDGESLEIYVDDQENIVLKKFSLMHKIDDFAQEFVDSIYTFLKHNIIITDNDVIIACAGKGKKDYLNKPISEDLQLALSRRENILEKYQKNFKIIDSKEEMGTYAINTIVVNGDAVGLVMVFSENEPIGELEKRIIDIASQFLAKYLEE